ncbi:venom allergen 5-like isoform X2 [Zophobas morio]|uniref:venom allergen 5-like isoform X2 n=1 Tax=Zophobas morio TaxID=2755281 RepID=UPI0030826E0D
MSSLSIITIQPLLAFLTHLLVIRGTYSHCDKRLIHTGVSEEEKQSILDAHNKMRQRVALGQINGQPQASDMMTMTWDNVLAAQAQNWATACTYTVHDSHRHLEAYFVGQNIATRWTTRNPRSFHDAKPSWTKDAMSPWFSEHQMYNFEPFTHTPASHYTQLIWAKTTLVGCGYAFYEERQRFTKKYVCNYGPSGNVIGEMPYRLGYPNCYNHRLSPSRKYSGLCEPGTNHYRKYGSDYFFNIKSHKECDGNSCGNYNNVFRYFHF